jgi:chemotaxis protein MotB
VRTRRRREEHPNHERWLVSYADFMTLLFALFVVLFASSHHDRRTIQSVSKAVRNGFQEMGAFSSSDSAADNSRIMGPTSTGEAQPSTVPANAGIDMIELQKKLHKALGKEIERQEVVLRMTPEGFVISLHELGFFESGQAQLMPGAGEKIKRIAEVLTQYGLDMRVEGHTDNVPIHNAQFGSNWDLSTSRAMVVAMMLLNESGVDPERMSIAGYAQYHPAADNATPEGRRQNRRVDIVVVSTATPGPARAPETSAAARPSPNHP